jgi:hypothetical protein
VRRALAAIALAAAALAQTPTGTITGLVADPSGAPVFDSKVTLTNTQTGLTRAARTGAEGTYTVPALPSGTYEVRVEKAGFRVIAREATVEAGTTTSVDFAMQVGTVSEVVTVAGTAPQIKFDSYKIDGVVTRDQVESLPLNGRNFLELAKLEPGVTVANAAARVDVSALGAANSAVTVDGGSINNPLGGQVNNKLSQEMVEEFQVSTVNFDLSSGGAAGSINIVTRSGGNAHHGSGFVLYRDHNTAAYPALKRDPTNPDPFFRRRQEGFNAGGPVRKNQAFYFVNLEDNRQDGAASVQPQTPEFAALGGIFPAPLTAKQYSVRADIRAGQASNLFVRYSHDDIRQLGTRSSTT